MLALSLSKNLLATLKKRLPKEAQELEAHKHLALVQSPLYSLQLKLIFAIQDLIHFLSSKDSSEIEIGRALSRVNRLSRLVYLKKRAIKRKQEEFEFFMAEKAKLENIFYFNLKDDETPSRKKHSFLHLVNALKKHDYARFSVDIHYYFDKIKDFFGNVFVSLKEKFGPKKPSSSRPSPKTSTPFTKERNRFDPFKKQGRFFGYAYANVQNQHRSERNSRPRFNPSPRPFYQPASHLRFGH